ncbi:MAG TPA: ABC transporter ATP-binding protein [Xanthobacteraceae bacterium]|nr:ABC transporter ATP-binding protein [Xanthobacteraceae bacterium]
MSALLAVNELVLAYGKIVAVKGVDLTIEAGRVVCLIGANGAGKTTILRGISGLLRPKSGKVEFQGEVISRMPSYRIARMGVVLVPEGRQIFTQMSVGENLRMGGYLVADQHELQRRLDEVVALFPRLKERLSQSAGSLSGGEQQMLAMGRALMAQPNVLLLDEPSMGLAPKLVEEIFELIAKLKAAQRTILLVEQNARLALEVSDDAYVLETGRIRLSGKAHEIATDERVLAAYLGG